ncbi:uncharacterized protein [Chelonus insularis]|uniref:uncharacterized protein n=1 Tax=Chelonus insularis TaxID=460826 RepID=UPI00158AE41B|nr:uncharacterized protein LOC118069121 [Chelonus insularis]
MCRIRYFNSFFCEELFSKEVQSLSELPLDKLIQLKSNLAAENNELEEPEIEPEMEGRIASPLSMQLKRHDPHRSKSIKRFSDWEESDNKISKIFHFALTTLAFLAFGGYLLCLVITSIRRNSVIPGNVIVLSSLQNLQKYSRPKRNLNIIDPIENNFDIDRAYQGMVMLSREYASYNKLK